MGLLCKFYKINGWIYYKKLGKTLATPSIYLPLTAQNYKNRTVLKNQINGKWISRDGNDFNSTRLIHNNPNALATIGELSYEVIFHGSSLSMRIKPAYIKNYPIILCVLYEDRTMGGIFVIALLDMQIVTYYYPKKLKKSKKKSERKDDITAERIDTGIYLDKNSWTSLGFNFHNKNGYGLTGIYRQGSGLINFNITPLKSMQDFSLFEYGYLNDELESNSRGLYIGASYQGGVTQLKIYRHNLTKSEFESDLANFDDNEDQGKILCDIEFKSGSLAGLGMVVNGK